MARRQAARLGALARTASPEQLASRIRRLRMEARAAALPYSRDEREALAFLFLPFLLVASAIVTYQSTRALQAYVTFVAAPEIEIAPVRDGTASGLPHANVPAGELREAVDPVTAPLAQARGPLERLPEARDAGPALASPHIGESARLAALDDAPDDTAEQTGTAALPQVGPVPASPPSLAADRTTLALLAPARPLADSARPVSPPAVETYEADSDGKPIVAGICSLAQAAARRTPAVVHDAAAITLTHEAFGLRLAQAAEAQVGAFVIYNDAYRRIRYPMGDVPSLFGVCTDVIVRAYRALGLDLQALVHEARSGRGDPSIDHRRAEVLRKFFATRGESVPVTSFAEDYQPGDIVTYHRPQNRGTQAHIAMVSSVVAPSGRLMIVHNRGRGPQLEDALFVDEITGHFRYRGPSATQKAAAAAAPAVASRPNAFIPASLQVEAVEPARSGRH